MIGAIDPQTHFPAARRARARLGARRVIGPDDVRRKSRLTDPRLKTDAHAPYGTTRQLDCLPV